MKDDTPFWKRKSLEQMTRREWESLCDGCGRCCLNKIEDEDTGKLYFTNVACKLLDHDTCRCTDYRNRLKQVPDCVGLTPEEVRSLDWLPPTCAYDLLAKGKDLYWWHPLVSGDPDTVHAAGISVRGRVGACESVVPDEELENWVVAWPGRVPKGAGKKRVGKGGASTSRAAGKKPVSR
ncbi:YcgN family cysteine cluster protein [Pseudorhodoplanes sp.]|uniref:YcgN family cysteine cluster protein n=1 Tax=Pseudorhodoplanes sp. TaxID=1934341 RepID=UPI00391CA438